MTVPDIRTKHTYYELAGKLSHCTYMAYIRYISHMPIYVKDPMKTFARHTWILNNNVPKVPVPPEPEEPKKPEYWRSEEEALSWKLGATRGIIRL